jgi:hypothetical protein
MNLQRREFLSGSALAAAGACAAVSLPMMAAADETAEGRVTVDSLGDVLKGLKLKPTRTESRYDFAFAAKVGGQGSEEWTLSMSVVLSKDEKSIWMMAWLDELPEDVPSSTLLSLLGLNDRLGNGHFFAFVPSNRRVVLERVVPNELVTTKAFKANLLDMGRTVALTYAEWSKNSTANRTAGKDDSDSKK